jgi:hypothetical protein
MKYEKSQKENKEEEKQKMVENYYKRIMRILEYYVLICFIIITIIPLLNFSWVQPFIKFVYLTGFPLLILIFIISLFKDPIIAFVLKIVNK